MSLITPDSGLLFWMTLIFAIVFVVLAKFGFPLITSMVDKRSERINASIAKAREAEESLKSLAEEQTRMLQQTLQEQARILKEASEAREEMLARAREDAQEEASKLIGQARAQIAAEKEGALREIRAQVSMLSVEVAEKVVRQTLSDDSGQMALIDKLVDELGRPKDVN